MDLLNLPEPVRVWVLAEAMRQLLAHHFTGDGDKRIKEHDQWFPPSADELGDEVEAYLADPAKMATLDTVDRYCAAIEAQDLHALREECWRLLGAALEMKPLPPREEE